LKLKRNLVLVNTRKLGGVSSIDKSTLYISNTWFIYTLYLYLVYSKYYKYIQVII